MGMRGKLRRIDRTTKSGFHSVFWERLFRILSTEMNLLDLHFIRDHSSDHGKRSKRHGWARQKLNQAWDLRCLLKTEVPKIKKSSIWEWRSRLIQKIRESLSKLQMKTKQNKTKKTTNESLLSNEKKYIVLTFTLETLNFLLSTYHWLKCTFLRTLGSKNPIDFFLKNLNF